MCVRLCVRLNGRCTNDLSSALSTVKSYVDRILQKLQVEDRRQAVVFAIRNGYVK
ncbi:response regulator transcription factor [Paenibacillus barcinonensis]|uniref:Response regulator transcription factor n=1 Tax=Paenibacillus barcinonensis TaxID=198119 RepID=A0ABX6Q8Z8_PAEBA|nr:response regulator transcription factor [Paenibacillus barcinonensis]